MHFFQKALTDYIRPSSIHIGEVSTQQMIHVRQNGISASPVIISEIASSNNGVKHIKLKGFSRLRDQIYRPRLWQTQTMIIGINVYHEARQMLHSIDKTLMAYLILEKYNYNWPTHQIGVTKVQTDPIVSSIYPQSDVFVSRPFLNT